MSLLVKLKFVLLFVGCIGLVQLSQAQTFCHTESSTPFTFLPSPTALTADSAWDDERYLLPIGFNFLFQGVYYDTLTVETNGKLYFSDILGSSDNPTITGFGGATNLVDFIDRGTPTDTSLSPISYQLFETPTDTFLVVEYKNIGFYKDQPLLSDSMSFQVKLHRTNGKIEIHIGPHKIIDTNSFYTTGPMIGLGSHFGDNGYFLTGDPLNPTVEKYINVLDTIPNEGMLYTFNPVLPNPSLSIVSNPLDGCYDPMASYTFTAMPVNEAIPALQWEKNGIPVAGEIGLIYSPISLNQDDSITCVMALSAACASALPITSNRIVVSRPIASIVLSSSSTSICNGDSILFTATVLNEGDFPIYKWITNADTITSADSEYMAVGLTDQDTVKCVLISDLRCVSNPVVRSDSIVVSVVPIATPLVSIVASKDSSCIGDSILFTAFPVFGGPTPVFTWKRNGQLVGGDSSTFYGKNLSDLDTISCEMVSSLPCATGIAISNELITKVRSYTLASVSIVSDITDFCAGQTSTFTSTVINGGLTPTYVWKNNGITSGSNNPVYFSNSFADGDSITCIATSSLFCSTTDTSNFIKLIVHPIIIPSITILANKDSICTGESLLFTASPVNGGAPSYQWIVNGSNAGTNSPFFSSTQFNNGDNVSCTLTPSLACLSSATASSAILSAKVLPYVNAGLTIASDASTVCTTTTVNFNATPSNGGLSPSYQWKKNGTPVGSNSSTFSASGFNNNDQVLCELSSSLMCVNGSPFSSAPILLNVLASQTSTISISPSQNPICSGGSITFTAAVTGIATPAYQWRLNGTTLGVNSPTFTASGFANNDQVLCKISNSIDCAGGLPTSNTILVSVSASADPIITIQPDINNICLGDPVTYSTSVTGAGSNLIYEWKRNSIVVGTNQPTLVVTSPADGDLVICKITTASNCSALSNTLSATVAPCLSTLEANGMNEVITYPNPFIDYFTVEFVAPSTTQVTLLDVRGNSIKKEIVPKASTYNAVWNLSEIPSGIYMLKIEGEKEIVLRKVVKQ